MIPSLGSARLPSSLLGSPIGSPCFEEALGEFTEPFVPLRSHSVARTLLVFARATISSFLACHSLVSLLHRLPRSVPVVFIRHAAKTMTFASDLTDSWRSSRIVCTRRLYPCTHVLLFVQYNRTRNIKLLTSVYSVAVDILKRKVYCCCVTCWSSWSCDESSNELLLVLRVFD